MSDLISRQEVLEALTVTEEMTTADLLWLLTTRINDLPSAEPERKKGKWLEMHCYEYKAQELQTCKCSVCGRYDTRPYLYYFSKPNFCSWCGADMKGEAE